jgi:alpha-L-rhamnosidase
VATPETYPELWETLLHDFGPQRKETGKHPDIYFANAFIGNYLRLDLLMNYGYEKEILDNMDGYFYYMAEQTGTLWENDGDYASCSHGFASHVIYWLDKLGMLEDVK